MVCCRYTRHSLIAWASPSNFQFDDTVHQYTIFGWKNSKLPVWLIRRRPKDSEFGWLINTGPSPALRMTIRLTRYSPRGQGVRIDLACFKQLSSRRLLTDLSEPLVYPQTMVMFMQYIFRCTSAGTSEVLVLQVHVHSVLIVIVSTYHSHVTYNITPLSISRLTLSQPTPRTISAPDTSQSHLVSATVRRPKRRAVSQ